MGGRSISLNLSKQPGWLRGLEIVTAHALKMGVLEPATVIWSVSILLSGILGYHVARNVIRSARAEETIIGRCRVGWIKIRTQLNSKEKTWFSLINSSEDQQYL
jgi:hypothetical protein